MTFKRHYHEDGLTDAEYDFMLPTPDPITVFPGPHSLERSPVSRSITKATQTETQLGPPPQSLMKVFGTYETAHKILLQLSPENLLCKVQRVCRTWHDLVQGSKRIQQYLFFRPVHKKLPWRRVRAPDGTDTWLQVPGTPDYHIENPWLYLFSTKLPATTGSWQRMLVTQPPTYSLRYNTIHDNMQFLSSYAELRGGPTLAPRGTEMERRYQRQWYSQGDRVGMKLSELYIAEGWNTWKPVLGWETVKWKRPIRLDEQLVETEIADELHWGSKAVIRKYSRWP